MSGKPGMFKGQRKGKIPQIISWDTQNVELLLTLWKTGVPLWQIIARFQGNGRVTRGVICGKIWRLRKVRGEAEVPIRREWLVEASRYVAVPTAVAQPEVRKQYVLPKVIVPRLAGNIII